jgi:beta-glucosidase
VLFGDVNPGGKLPVTFPRHTGQLPVYYNRRPTSFRNHLDLVREPLWSFGFGLSYTTFTLADLQIALPVIGPGGRTDVSARVTNTGARAGDEVVQLYIRDQVSSVTRPVRELRGFERVTLKPGESKRVTFVLGPEELSLIDRRMQRVVEPGRFDVMVGTSLTPILTGTLDVVAR